jgi:hypothetical protein
MTITLEPARVGVASEIRYSTVTHGYHLFSATGEMLGNPYGYESYLEAERADTGRCLACGQPSEDPICSDCQTTTHRCEAGHALGDMGECEVCDAENERIRQEAYALPETEESRRLIEFGKQVIQRLIAERMARS